MINFNNVSQNVRASDIFIELAGVPRSLASLFIPPTGGIPGQYDPTKTSVVDYEPVKVLSADDGGSKFGFGSHLHRQLLRLPASVFLQGGGVYCFPVADGVAAVAATEDITITGAATSAGSLFFSIGGDLIQVGVASGDAVGDIATAIETAITAKQNLAVTAIATLGVAAVTAKFKGLSGNQILIKQNPGGDSQESQAPAGVTVVLSEVDGYLASGATDPSVEDVFFDSGGNDKLGSRFYTAFTAPYTDTTNLGFHNDSAAARFNPATHLFFASYAGYIKETYAAALALPATENSKFIGQVWEDRYEAPAFELAAALVGQILDSQNQAPSRPYKTLEVDGQFDNTVSNRRDDENDALYKAGMSFCKVTPTGTKLIFGDIALTYRTNDVGGASEEWFDAVSLHLRQAKTYSIDQIFLADKYQRAVVVDNAQVTAVNYAIAPKDVVAELTKLIEDLWGEFAWSKNIDEIIETLSAEINTNNQSRIDTEFIDDEARALRILAVSYGYYF